MNDKQMANDFQKCLPARHFTDNPKTYRQTDRRTDGRRDMQTMRQTLANKVNCNANKIGYILVDGLQHVAATADSAAAPKADAVSASSSLQCN